MQHTVRNGDSLQSIAKQHYGDECHWPRIWHANQQRMKTPTNLPTGEKLTIPGVYDND